MQKHHVIINTVLVYAEIIIISGLHSRSYACLRCWERNAPVWDFIRSIAPLKAF